MSLCKNQMRLRPSIIQFVDEGIVINYVVVEVRVKIVQVFNLDLSSIRNIIFHQTSAFSLLLKIEINISMDQMKQNKIEIKHSSFNA